MVSNLSRTSSVESATLLSFSAFSSPDGRYSLNWQALLPSFRPFRTRPVRSSAASCSFWIFFVLIRCSTNTSFSAMAVLIFLMLCNCCRNSLACSRSLAASWACRFFLFRWRMATYGNSLFAFSRRTMGLALSQSITRSFSFSMSPSRGLQECPLSGAITDGTSLGWYRCLPSSGASQTSRTAASPSSRVGLLLQVFLGRAVWVGLKRSASRGGRVRSLSSVTTRSCVNWTLSSSSWARALASSSSETSMFLAHFFLFCFPFSPFTFTSYAISTSKIRLLRHSSDYYTRR